MPNPILAEVLRGGRVESRHSGSLVVVDGDGSTVLAKGDVERPVFPRSAVKAIQALPFVESGAADAYGFGCRELSLACASHSGEPRHVELAASMLARAGLDGDALECGAHWPTGQDATLELARSGARPSALHNNCSGKHSGFLCGCRHMGLDHRGYVRIGHDYQRLIAATMSEVTGAAHQEGNSGIDGCSIPTYAVPLRNLALGFARMATGRGIGEARHAAARRLMEACMAEPFFMSGTGRADKAMLEAGEGRVFVKTGAEGVYCGAIPEKGIGFALKADDGAARASEVAVAALVASLLRDDDGMSARFAALSDTVLRNWNGIEVGRVRAVAIN